MYYIFHLKNKYRYLNYPNQANCVTVSFQFPPMSVTYKVNYLVKCSEYLCNILGKLYHCIIPFSDNIRPTILSGDGEKKGGRKKRENNGGKSDNYDVAIQPPNGNPLQRRYLCLFS